MSGYTGIPHFSKAYFAPLRSYERPTLAPVSANQKKPQEDFHFYKTKRAKQKQHSACLTAACCRGSVHPGHLGTAQSLPGNLAQHLSIKPPWFGTVSLSVSICALSWFILCIR